MLPLPQGRNAVKQAAKQVGADLRGASRTLDGGGDVTRHRHDMFHAGRIPNITESPGQHRTATHRRTRRFDAAIHALRMRVERTVLATRDPGRTATVPTPG